MPLADPEVERTKSVRLARFPRFTQCYSVQFGRLLRGTIKLSGMHGSQAVDNFEGDSVYAWNPKANRAQFTFWASDGTYGTGEMYREGERLIFPPTGNADSPTAVRSVWHRVDADSFVVTREKRQGETWSKVFEVTYRRSGAQHANAGADASEVNRVVDEYVSAYRGADWRRMSKILAEDVAFEDPTFRLKQSNKAGVVKMMQQSEGGFSDISLGCWRASPRTTEAHADIGPMKLSSRFASEDSLRGCRTSHADLRSSAG